jgi:hypothetical protein
MAGAIAIVIVLLIFPVLFLMGMAVVAAALGTLLWKDGEARHEGSELLDVGV